jgi:hypothetical protein
MSYNSISNFKLYAYPSGSYNDIPNDTIQFQLNVAASEIDAALRPFHTLPLNTSTYNSGSELALIYNAEIIIASYKLMSYIGFKPNADETVDTVLRNQYLEIKGLDGLLDKLSQGKLILPMDSDATPTTQEKRPRMYGNPARSTRLVGPDGTEYI